VACWTCHEDSESHQFQAMNRWQPVRVCLAINSRAQLMNIPTWTSCLRPAMRSMFCQAEP